jgi:hypothetical protein
MFLYLYLPPDSCEKARRHFGAGLYRLLGSFDESLQARKMCAIDANLYEGLHITVRHLVADHGSSIEVSAPSHCNSCPMPKDIYRMSRGCAKWNCISSMLMSSSARIA